MLSTDASGHSSGTQTAAILLNDTAVIGETVPSGLSGIEGGVISLAGISVSDVQNPGDTLTTVLAVSRGTSMWPPPAATSPVTARRR